MGQARGTRSSEICASVHAPNDSASTSQVRPRDIAQSAGPAASTSSVYRTSTSVSEYERWKVITSSANDSSSRAGVIAAAYGVPKATDAAAKVIVSATVSA